ncbi:YidB family protein [Lysobacter sp. 5GHs7-4]|uniref:YidB family protein n=1 Tax=Lysobacter sp. 5GHs7-4 TaxID=2904253 RepID=UPI001E4A47FD|nr:YidB family protein [Lysobacter sp. 5GHs7-4]UHQ21948.1 YidB family protein [Lysobacter sp. 5GHs7-4]
MFEHLLDQVASRHGLSPDQGRRLLAAWLERIFDPARGGTAGFVQAFREQGLAELAESWIAPGPNRPLTADQLERVFGEGEIAALARALALPAAAVASASAAILPEAVDTLGEDGRWHGGGAGPHRSDPDRREFDRSDAHRPEAGWRDAHAHDPDHPHIASPDPHPHATDPFAAPAPGAASTTDPGGLHPIRDVAPGPLSSEPAPLYRADDDPPPPSPLLSFARRLWPWLLLFAFLSALAWWLRV